MKITFTERREVQDEKRGTPEATVFEAGKTYDLPPPSAERWLSRGVAVIAEDKPKAVARPKATTMKTTPDVKA